MYFGSVKRIIFPVVCILSLFLNLMYFLSYSNTYRQNINKERSSTVTTDRILVSNTTDTVKNVDSFETNNTMKFAILPSVKCDYRNVNLVICVPSGRDNFYARDIIRQTWGSYANSSSNNAILLFFVGLGETNDDPLNRRTQQFLVRESKFYGDIVQGDFKDSYRNLTLKSLSILSWVTFYCSKSQFVLKADDDMYVNIPLLVQTLKNTSSGTNRFIMGQALTDGRPHRDPSSKWFVAYKEYPEEIYPHFVLGPSYVMTTVAAKRLYHASHFVPFFYLEDVYITGLCAKKARVSVLYNSRFANYKMPVNGCTFRNHISAHGYLPEEIVQIHNQLYDSKRPCN